MTTTIPVESASPSRHLPAWLDGGWGLAFIGTAIYCSFYGLWTLWHWGAADWQLFIADAGYLPVSLVATLACGRIWRDSTVEPALRRAWGLIGLALFANFIGDLLWFNYEVIQQTTPFPSWADAGYLGYYPLVMLGVLNFPYPATSKADQRSHSLDIAIILVASSMVIWYFLLAPNATTLTFSPEGLLLVAYPLIDLAIIYGLVVFIFRRPGYALQNGFGYLLVGLLLFVVGDFIYGLQALAGTYVSGSPLDITWLLSYLCFAWAALIQYASLKTQTTTFGRVGSLSLLFLLPYAMLALGFALSVISFLSNETITLEVQGLFGGSLLLTVLVTTRQILDLRENRRLNTELRLRLQQLEETGLALDRAQYLASVGTLAAGVAHEINNPMGVIVASTEMLQRRIKNDQLDRTAFDTNLSRIERSAWHITRIVSSLLTYARGGDLTLTSATPQTLIDDAIYLRHLTPDTQIDLRVTIAPDAPRVRCDTDKITQVLVNLIANACDAVSEAPLPRIITLTAQANPSGGLNIIVKDNGTGMESEVMARAFDPFYTTKPVGKGTGLGLSICRGIVEAHQGQLTLTSEKGCGTTVTLTLPLEPKLEHRR